MPSTITIQTIVKAPIAKVWECWNKPEHVIKWAFADDTWEAPAAENDLRAGGRFKITMAAKDKSASFDFTGTYTAVKEHELIEYDMDRAPDEQVGRHVKVEFSAEGGSASGGGEAPDGVKITEIFDPESKNPLEMQRKGWQAILDNFKKYVENFNN